MERKSACGCAIILLLINLCLGGLSLNYCLESVYNKHVDFWIAGIVGFFVGELTIPIAIICWVIRLAGIPAPFVH